MRLFFTLTFCFLLISIANAGGLTSTLSGFSSRNATESLKIEMKLFNRQTLPDLIPSVERIPVQGVDKAVPLISSKAGKEPLSSLEKRVLSKNEMNGDEAIEKRSMSRDGEKYIFGIVQYKDYDLNPIGGVVLEIYSPNNPNLKVSNVRIIGISQNEVYFLVYAGAPVMDTIEEGAVLNYKIMEVFAAK